MQDSIDCDSLFASWRITVGWISQTLSRWLHNLQNIVTFDFGMQFVKFLWDCPDAPQKNHVLVHCKAFSVARKFPCPALNAFVWNHCDHGDKERKCFPRPFLCFSKHQFFRQCHICISSYLLNIDYTIVLYIFIVFWCLSEVAGSASLFWWTSTHALTLTHTSNPKMCSSLIVSECSRHIYKKCIHHVVIYLICVFSNE